MPTYTVIAHMTISVRTEVEAPSLAQATDSREECDQAAKDYAATL